MGGEAIHRGCHAQRAGHSDNWMRAATQLSQNPVDDGGLNPFRLIPVPQVRTSKGFMNSAPSSATSETLRVTSVMPSTLAVAADNASIVDTARLALIRPHSSATAR